MAQKILIKIHNQNQCKLFMRRLSSQLMKPQLRLISEIHIHKPLKYRTNKKNQVKYNKLIHKHKRQYKILAVIKIFHNHLKANRKQKVK